MSPTRNMDILEKPLSARSVVASLLLGMHPPRLSGGRLVQWCRLFGMTEGAARTALSRMVDRGELVADDGVYELVGRVRARQAGQEWSLAPTLLDWDGRWRLVVVTADARSAPERAAFRAAARAARLAEQREGVWT